MPSFSSLTTMLTACNAVAVYQLLVDQHRVPPRPESFVHHMGSSLEWECIISVNVEGPDHCDVALFAQRLAATKADARRAAYRDILTQMSGDLSDKVEEIGQTRRSQSHTTRTAASRGPPQPRSDPTYKQQRIINAAADHMQSLGQLASRVRAGLPVRMLVVDVEVAERGTQPLLEVGVVVVDIPAVATCPASPTVDVRHYWIREHKQIRNRFCVGDPEAFAYGTSLQLPKQAALDALAHELAALSAFGPGAYVCGHAMGNDAKWLLRDGLNIYQFPWIDTSEVERAHFATDEQLSLDRVSRAVHGIAHGGPAHNAGNDAAVTAAVIGSQATRYHAGDLLWLPIQLTGLADKPAHVPAAVESPVTSPTDSTFSSTSASGTTSQASRRSRSASSLESVVESVAADNGHDAWCTPAQLDIVFG